MILKSDTKAVVKDVDERNNTIEGYFSIFNNIDSDMDIIAPGAYQETIQKRGREGSNRIAHVYEHDKNKPLARPELKEDETGLFFRSKISNTSFGNDIIQLYRDEVLTEHSVRIEIEESEMLENEIQQINKVTLWEGSTVLWGANPEAKVEDVKNLKYRIEKSLQTGLTDQTCKTLEELRDSIDKLLSHQKNEAYLQSEEKKLDLQPVKNIESLLSSINSQFKNS